MRLLLFFIIFFAFNIGSIAQPAGGNIQYHDRYAHPQKSNFNFQFKAGLTAINTNESLINDIKGQNLFLKPHFALGVGYQYTNYISFLFRTTYYRHSYNAAKDRPNFDGIKSNNFDAVIGIKHYLFPLRHYDEYLRKFNYYAYAGGGLLYHNPKERTDGWNLADSLGFNTIAVVVPVGLGVEYKLSNFFQMGLELTFHVTGTDYLDGIAVSKGGHKLDQFGTTSVNIIYRIPRKDYNYKNFLKLRHKDK